MAKVFWLQVMRCWVLLELMVVMQGNSPVHWQWICPAGFFVGESPDIKNVLSCLSSFDLLLTLKENTQDTNTQPSLMMIKDLNSL